MNYYPHPWLGNYNVRKDKATHTITIYADIFIYGSKANEKVATDISRDVRDAWNAARAKITIDKKIYAVRFAVRGYYTTSPQNWITGNKDYKKIFMRVEDHTDAPSGIQISYMDGIGSNSGVFLIQNILGKHSTTEPHEIGHGWGRVHEGGGHGQPGIMWPRGTSVDPQYRYNPKDPNSTVNPEKRRVLTTDVHKLGLEKLKYDAYGRANLGKLTNKFHPYQ